MPNKRGRFGIAEEKKILQLIDKYDVPEIAKRLNRTPEAIQQWIDLNKKPADATSPEGFKTAIRQELRHSLSWQNLKREFTPDELLYFEEEYLKMIRQFKDDILPSEEIQVFDFVKISILMSRCLQRQNKTREAMERTRGEVKKIRDNYESIDAMPKDIRDTVVHLDNRVTFLESAEQSHINEYTKLSKEKSDLMKNLKVTRDQRVREIANTNSFIDLVKQFQKRDFQEQESRHAEIMRKGTAKEYKRLTTPHIFLDKQTDLPILSPETAAAQLNPPDDASE